MVIHGCCAINCKNNKTNRPDLKFFRFPSTSTERIWEWVVNLGRVDLLGKDMSELCKSYIVCAEHFESHYFMNVERRKLVHNAVPTIFNHYSHEVNVPLILEVLNRIENEAAVTSGCDEQIQKPSQCSQQLPEETNCLGSNPQRVAIKSYECQLCKTVFLTAHQLFAHELKKHDGKSVGTSKIKALKCSLCEKVFNSENEVWVHEIEAHDWDLEAQVSGGNSQKQDGNPQTEASNMRERSEKEERNSQTETSNMRERSEKEEKNPQTKAFNMRERSEKEERNPQTETSNMRERSEKEERNPQTETSNMRERSEKEERNPQTETSNMKGKSLEQDGNPKTEASHTNRKSEKQYRCKSCLEIFSSVNDLLQHETKTHAVDMNNEKETNTAESSIVMYMCSLCKKTFISKSEVSTHECVTSDQTPDLVYEKSFNLERQQFSCEPQVHNKETELLQQDDGNTECNFQGENEDEETASEAAKLPEPMMLPEPEVIPLQYKCPSCEESFETKSNLFYHDLEVHVGITKPTTLQTRDISLKGAKKNANEKTALIEGGMKRIAKNVSEQQPRKVIITEKQNTKSNGKEQQIETCIARQMRLWKANAENTTIKKQIIIKGIEQGDGMKIKVRKEKLQEHTQKAIEAITGKEPWSKTSVGQGEDEQGGQTHSETFVIIKEGSQSEEENQEISGGRRIDVVTKYVLSRSQAKKLLINDGVWSKE